MLPAGHTGISTATGLSQSVAKVTFRWSSIPTSSILYVMSLSNLSIITTDRLHGMSAKKEIIWCKKRQVAGNMRTIKAQTSLSIRKV